MKRSAKVLALAAALGALACPAYTKHYSFSGGYPANSGVSSRSAAAVENGGASMTTSAQARKRVVNAEQSIVGRVTRVVDGDTIVVTPNGGRGIKVRMRRIDAPESDQPGGDKATAFLKELISDKTVEVRYAERDDYGRVLGMVFVRGEKGEKGERGEVKLVDVNLTMVLNGWAWHYYSFKTNDKIPAYDKAEQAARNAKAGLWAEENPIRPYDWRKGKR